MALWMKRSYIKEWMKRLSGSKIAMDRKETYVNNLLISLIENWNDQNPKSRLSPELICNIRLHLDYAYTVGMERAFRKINREFKKYEVSGKVSNALMKRILDPRTYEL